MGYFFAGQGQIPTYPRMGTGLKRDSYWVEYFPIFIFLTSINLLLCNLDAAFRP
jgi:hypothetical protein